MKATGKYVMISRVDELEAEIKEMIESTRKDQEIINTVEVKSDLLTKLDYDLECDVRLFEHLLETITFYRSVVCITDEKHIVDTKEES